ncbi:cytochrome c biogenesis protein ResB [Actinomyces slackii]|uniref:Cytochrome c biogenesis protein CcsB n=1 Tax=Actinomyces slackii TaxID=52774 RepID=A0A448K9D4_9ACTO|nr:cytochrome c biogenesis protein ResB [Actinomyces slackii]VEG73559.1 Cytochrome c biogenesis protein CcsB [Actinomyces slackii]
MSEKKSVERTAPTSGSAQGPATDGLDDQAAVPLSQVLKQVYAFFYKKSVGIVLILLAGTLCLIGAVVPQMTDSVRTEPEAAQQWLEQVRPVFGGWAEPLSRIGLFSMFTSIPFLVVMGLLAASIIACTAHRLPVLWKAARHPRTRVTAAFFDRARLRTRFTTDTDVDSAFETIIADARAHRLRVITEERGPGRNAYIDRNAWAPFGTAVVHAAFVLIMIGVVVSSFTGFRDDRFTLTVGHPRQVGHGTELVAQANGFQDLYYEDGSPKDYVADVTLTENGRQVARQDVRVNSPLSYDGVMFHQAYFGVSAVMRVVDSSGREVLHDGVALEWSTQDGRMSYGRADLPEGATLYVVGSASGQTGTGIEPGQVRAEIYQGDSTPIDGALLDMGQETDLGGYTITFEREQQYTGMIVKRDPGTIVVWAGFALLAVGTFMTLLLRHHRMWLRVSSTEEGTLVQMASPDRQDSAFTRFFTDMAVRVSGELDRRVNERTSPDA